MLQVIESAPGAQMMFPGIEPSAVVDRECVIAMFSEVCAEAARLSVLKCHVVARVGVHGLEVSIQTPSCTGPFASRCVFVSSYGSVDSSINLLNVFEGDDWCCARYVSHNWNISYYAPVLTVEPVVEEILRHFALMTRNLDATRVYREVAV